MIPIYGPFIVDPNVPVALLAFDDKCLFVLRRSLQDESARKEYGLLEFIDVRAYRSRARTCGNVPDVDDASIDWWTMQLEESDYLTASRLGDPQRSATALASHRHFVVVDGNHRAFDLVARSARVRALHGPLALDIRDVLEDDNWHVG